MDKATIEQLLQKQTEKNTFIRELYKQIQREKEILAFIQKNISKKCVNHSWADDGTFDVQNNNGHWICTICKRYKN